MEELELYGRGLLAELPRIIANLSAPSDLCRCRAVCLLWQPVVQSAESAWEAALQCYFPKMAAGVGDGAEQQSPLARDGWFSLFLSRCGKRREWALKRESEKARKAERAARLQEDASQDGERGRATKFAIGPEGRNSRVRTVREKTCKRCGLRYMPLLTGSTADCYFHTGKYQQVDDDGAALLSSMEDTAFQREVREHLKKTVSRPGSRKSKGKHLEVIAADPVTGVFLDFKWSCCGEAQLNSRGCRAAEHC